MKLFSISDSKGNCELVRAINVEIALWFFVNELTENVSDQIYLVHELDENKKIGVVKKLKTDPEIYLFSNDKWVQELQEKHQPIQLGYEVVIDQDPDLPKKNFPVNHEIWKEIDLRKTKPTMTIKVDKDKKEAKFTDKQSELLSWFYGLSASTQNEINDFLKTVYDFGVPQIIPEDWLKNSYATRWFEESLYPLAVAYEKYRKYKLRLMNPEATSALSFGEVVDLFGVSKESVENFINLVDTRYTQFLEDVESVREILMSTDISYITGITNPGIILTSHSTISLLNFINSPIPDTERLLEIRRRLKILDLVPEIKSLRGHTLHAFLQDLGISTEWQTEVFSKEYDLIENTIKSINKDWEEFIKGQSREEIF